MRPSLLLAAAAGVFVLADYGQSKSGELVHEASEYSADLRRVTFKCDDGKTVEMRFSPNAGAAALIRDGRTTELNQQPSGSGFRYAGGATTVTGKGDDLTLELDQAAPVRCRAAS